MVITKTSSALVMFLERRIHFFQRGSLRPPSKVDQSESQRHSEVESIPVPGFAGAIARMKFHHWSPRKSLQQVAGGTVHPVVRATSARIRRPAITGSAEICSSQPSVPTEHASPSQNAAALRIPDVPRDHWRRPMAPTAASRRPRRQLNTLRNDSPVRQRRGSVTVAQDPEICAPQALNDRN